MNNNLWEKVKSKTKKPVKFESNIRPSHLSTSLAFKGIVGKIFLCLDFPSFKELCQKNQAEGIRIYQTFNSITCKLFKKHRNFMTMRSVNNKIIGYFNLAEIVDYNQLFELGTMFNAFRSEFNAVLKQMFNAEIRFNIYLSSVQDAYIMHAEKDSSFFAKKDDEDLEDTLIFFEPEDIHWDFDFDNQLFYLNEVLFAQIKTDYQKMCNQISPMTNSYSSTAKASISEKFEW